MEQVQITGRLEEIKSVSIDTCILSSYEKGETFEEIEECLECGRLLVFDSKLLRASGILIRELKSIPSSGITEGLVIYGAPVIMKFVIRAAQERPTYNVIYGSNLGTSLVTTYREFDSLFMIILSKDFYFNLIHQTYKDHKKFISHIFSNKTTNLFDSDIPINPHVLTIINEIRNCGRTGLFKRIFIENKVQELLLLQLELYQHQKEHEQLPRISSDQVGKLNEVIAILETNFTKPPSIGELSKSVFLNESKLRKSFKTYFGFTIKDYVINLKMKLALQLLKENKHNITEIADLCGYNGLVQFSVAFKRMYGCSPKKFKV